MCTPCDRLPHYFLRCAAAIFTFIFVRMRLSTFTPHRHHRPPTTRIILFRRLALFSDFNERFCCAICGFFVVVCWLLQHPKGNARKIYAPTDSARDVHFIYCKSNETERRKRCGVVNRGGQRATNEMNNRRILFERQLEISLLASQVHIPKLT